MLEKYLMSEERSELFDVVIGQLDESKNSIVFDWHLLVTTMVFARAMSE